MVEFSEGLLAQWLVEEMFLAIGTNDLGQLGKLYTNLIAYVVNSTENPEKIDVVLRSQSFSNFEAKIDQNQIPTPTELLECAREFERLLK